MALNFWQYLHRAQGPETWSKSIRVIEYTFLPWRTQCFWAGFWSKKKRRLVFDPRKRDILTAFVTLSGGSAGQKNIQCGAAISHHLVVMYKSILPMELLSNVIAYDIFHFDMNHLLNRWNRKTRGGGEDLLSILGKPEAFGMCEPVNASIRGQSVSFPWAIKWQISGCCKRWGFGEAGLHGRPWIPRLLVDTPGKRAEGPGSPKGGKMEEEWPENEGWTTGSEWAGQGQRLDSPISVLLTLGTNGWSRLINDYKWWVIGLPKSSPLLPFWSSFSPPIW